MENVYQRKMSLAYERQKPLITEYKINPQMAYITDSAKIIGGDFENPFNTVVEMNATTKNKLRVGLHKAVGGSHDQANPGDILCASLAACLETTLRMVASRLHIMFTSTKIEVGAEVDVRGTLMLDASVPVGFQKMWVHAGMECEIDTPEPKKKLLWQTTEHCCVVYQTLKQAIPIEVRTNF